MSGGLRILLAESLLIPSGLLTAAYLARRLGPDGYGVFMVAAALIAWVEWGLTGVFARATVKFVAEAADWRAVGSTIASVHLALASVAALLVAALADVVARALETPALAAPLRLFALDIPLFCLAQAHRNILVGIGDFGSRAVAAAARWVSRLLLVIVFVELGLSIEGAVLGSIGASLLELLVCRRYVRPGLAVHALRGAGRLWAFAAPLFVSAVALRLFDRLDLVALTRLGATSDQAGHYGAAQNLAILPSLIGLSFTPLLLASLTRAFRDTDLAQVRRSGRNAMRGIVLLLPFAGLCAGAGSGIVDLVFGPAFAPAAGLIAPLLFAAVALVLIGVSTAILIAAGRPGLSAAFTGPLPVIAGVAYLMVIPRHGPLGGATVTLTVAVLGAIAVGIAVHLVCRVHPPLSSMLRSAVVTAAAYAAAVAWPATGPLVLLELGVLSLAIGVALAVTGEFTPAELAAVRAWWEQERRPET